MRSVDQGAVASATEQADTRARLIDQVGGSRRLSLPSTGSDSRYAAPPRLLELDMARGAAVLLVVVMHASLLFPTSVFIEQFNMVAAGIRMPLLMFVTGYLFATTRAIGRRLTQYGWVFALWTLIIISVQNIHQPSAIPNFYLREFMVPTSALWFVWSAGLMGLSLIALRKVHAGVVLAVTAILTMLNESGLAAIQYYTLEHSVGNAFFFFFGAYHGSTILGLAQKECRRILLYGPVVILTLRGVDYWAVQTFGWQVIGIPERIVAILFALTFARWVAKRVGSKSAPMVWVGRNTLPIFVTHGLLLGPVASIFTGVQPEIAIVLLTISVVWVSLALHRLASWYGLGWIYAVPEPVLQAIQRCKDRWSSAITALPMPDWRR